MGIEEGNKIVSKKSSSLRLFKGNENKKWD